MRETYLSVMDLLLKHKEIYSFLGTHCICIFCTKYPYEQGTMQASSRRL